MPERYFFKGGRLDIIIQNIILSVSSYDKENDIFETINITNEKVIVKNDYMTIDVASDKVVYKDSFSFLIKDFNMLNKFNDI